MPAFRDNKIGAHPNENIATIWLSGTEHMEKEYHQKWFHVKVCFQMIPVFALMGVLSALIRIWIW